MAYEPKSYRKFVPNNESNTERLESIKNKLYDFQTTVWDLSEDDYMWLYQQSERAIITEQLAENLGVLNEYLQKNLQPSELRWGESVSLIAIDYMDRLENENKRLRETLGFYADKENYRIHHDDLLDELPTEIDFDSGEKARQALDNSK